MREININEIENVKIGSAENSEAATGCTVIICERGASAGVDVRGGGPASRETELLSHQATCSAIHAVLLSGGSAYGLDAAGGVMEYLESKGVGLSVGPAVVPLVCQSCIFDLGIGSHKVRPDKEMPKKACENAELNVPRSGNYGAGAGATVGKLLGPDFAMKSGLGLYALQLGELKVGAVAAVNAFGDVLNEDGSIVAGLLNADKRTFRDSEKTLYEMAEIPAGNTTIGAVITNGKFTKAEMTKIAQMAQDGLSRAIRPVHTTMDGDTVYGLSVGDIESGVDLCGTLAARVMAGAIRRAVLSAQSSHGLLSVCDLK